MSQPVPTSPPSCAAPDRDFAVHDFELSLRVGEKVRLSAFSNRLDSDGFDDVRVRLDWRALEAPAGSAAVGEHLTGTISPLTTARCEQVAVDGQVPTFTPDVEGRYVFELEATALDSGAVARAQTTLLVSGLHDASEPGCSSTGAMGPLAVLLVWAWRRTRAARW